MKKLFLIDAFALIYRSFFAFSKSPILTSKGFNTSAIYGFTNTLIEIIQKEKPDYIAVAFDSPEISQRSENFLAYKAHRAAMPEGIVASLPYCYQMMQAMGIPCYALAGYEADDLIGTIATQLGSEDLQVYMVTPDKDYGQLVTEYVFMYKPRAFGGGYEVLGVSEICEKFQVKRPEQIADLLGLWGDAADNIPGIPGVGEKTAQKLLAQYDNLETVLHYARVQKGKLGENLQEFAEQGRISKALASIIVDVPFDYHLEDMRFKGIDVPKMEVLLKELEFKTLGKKILAMQAVLGQSLTVITQAEHKLSNTEHQYSWVETPEERLELLQKLQASAYFCLDTETTSLEERDAELVVLSFSIKKGEGFCMYFDENQHKTQEILNEFLVLFQDTQKIVIGQNIKYDYKILLKYGILLKNKLWDTMLAHYLLFPEKNHNLNLLSEQYLNYYPIHIEELIGKKSGKTPICTMRDVEKDLLLDYSAEDVDITLQLYFILQEELKKDPFLWKLFEEVEMLLVPILAQMEWKGIMLDVDFLHQYAHVLEKDMKEVEVLIFQQAGMTWNLDSPKQLGEVLFDKLKITDKAKKTKTGQYATAEEELMKIDHPLVKEILKYRGLKKLKSTYVDALPALIHPQTARIHTSFMQTGTVTGRLSSKEPNLQNIPIKTEQGKEVRRAFIAPEGFVLLAADYSQIELRIMAALSKDKNMIAAFKNKEDIHRATASKIYGIPLEEVSQTQRRNAKAVNFGIIYGQTAFGLSQTLQISPKEAREIIDHYFQQYPQVKQYMDDVVQLAEKQGFVSTILGRKRFLPDIHSANHVLRGFAQRNAINSPLQGSAADIIKLAMIRIDQMIQTKQVDLQLILQVHDELVFEVKKTDLEAAKKSIKIAMEEAYIFEDVALEIEIGTAKNWLQAH